jgi:hypothetical protein
MGRIVIVSAGAGTIGVDRDWLTFGDMSDDNTCVITSDIPIESNGVYTYKCVFHGKSRPMPGDIFNELKKQEVMTEFTAKVARALRNEYYSEELNTVIELIKNSAKDYSWCWIHQPMSSSTVRELERRGFVVERANGLATQKEGIYSKISWEEI